MGRGGGLSLEIFCTLAVLSPNGFSEITVLVLRAPRSERPFFQGEAHLVSDNGKRIEDMAARRVTPCFTSVYQCSTM